MTTITLSCNLPRMALVTVKLDEDTRRMLRRLAAHSDTTMHRVAADLAWKEMQRLKLSLRTEVKDKRNEDSRTRK